MAASESPQPLSLQRYEVGQRLELEVEGQLDSVTSSITVEVMRLQSPNTLSSSLVVKILEAPNKEQTGTYVFLKSYDRRFADQVRKNDGIVSWNEVVENSCLEFAMDGKEEEFLQRVHNDRALGILPKREDWTVAEKEAFLAYELHEVYEKERALYGVLQKYQGEVFPLLFAAVTRNIMPTSASHSKPAKLYQIKGLLLQYLDGFSLTTMAGQVPRLAWQGIFDQAIRIARILSDNNIVNREVRLENYTIVPRGQAVYQVFMINLAQCRLRWEDESDTHWGVAKCDENEEGFIGNKMQEILGKERFVLNFEHSGRYSDFVQKEDDKYTEEDVKGFVKEYAKRYIEKSLKKAKEDPMKNGTEEKDE